MQLRQDLGREDGWRNGFRQPRWQDSSHGRRQLVRHPGGRGAPGNEVAFLVTSGANFRGYRSGAEFAGGESFAQRPEGGPPQGAAASCPVSARVDTRGGPHTSPWERMPPQHALHVLAPYLARQRCRGGRRPPRAPMGPEPLSLSGEGGGGSTESRSRRAHGRFTQVRAAMDA